MPRLFVGNFDFEHELAGDVAANERRRRLNAQLAGVWLAVAEDGDAIWSPGLQHPGWLEGRAASSGELNAELELEPTDRSTSRGASAFPCVRFIGEGDSLGDVDEFVPWGWSDRVRALAERLRVPFRAPSTGVVRRVNSREFSVALERELGVALPGTRLLRSASELAPALAAMPAHHRLWVVKANLGMSGRERFLGQTREPTVGAAGWIERRTASGEPVVLEPWVDRVAEAGLNFTVPADGPPVFEGVTELLTDDSGHYVGSRFSRDAAVDEPPWREAIAIGHRVAARVGELGYFGPLGIDACRYRDGEGVERLRPVQDVNARWTMGRLALGWRRLLDPGEVGTWLLPPRDSDGATAIPAGAGTITVRARGE